MPFLLNRTNKDIPDEEIIARFIESGNPSNIGVLFNSYAKLVMGVCLKYLKDEDEAADTTMNIFKNLIETISNYEIRVFKPWLYTYTKNECLMKLRKVKPIVCSIDKVAFGLAGEEDDEERIEIPIEKLQTAISELKNDQKICIQMFYLENLSYNEISDKTGYSWKEIKSHIQNGKRNLRNILISAENEK